MEELPTEVQAVAQKKAVKKVMKLLQVVTMIMILFGVVVGGFFFHSGFLIVPVSVGGIVFCWGFAVIALLIRRIASTAWRYPGKEQMDLALLALFLFWAGMIPFGATAVQAVLQAIFRLS